MSWTADWSDQATPADRLTQVSIQRGILLVTSLLIDPGHGLLSLQVYVLRQAGGRIGVYLFAVGVFDSSNRQCVWSLILGNEARFCSSLSSMHLTSLKNKRYYYMFFVTVWERKNSIDLFNYLLKYIYFFTRFHTWSVFSFQKQLDTLWWKENTFDMNTLKVKFVNV